MRTDYLFTFRSAVIGCGVDVVVVVAVVVVVIQYYVDRQRQQQLCINFVLDIQNQALMSVYSQIMVCRIVCNRMNAGMGE